MAEVICEVCGRKIDSRGLSGHMRSHKGKSKKGDSDGGVISYPSNEHEIKNETQIKQPVLQDISKKPVKKPVVSKPASSPASKSNPSGNKTSSVTHTKGDKSASSAHTTGSTDTRGQRKSEQELKKEWKGLFRD